MVTLVKSRIEFGFDHVTICGQRVNCQPEVPHGQWLDFWNSAKEIEEIETVEELHYKIDQLEEELRSVERRSDEVMAENKALKEKINKLESEV